MPETTTTARDTTAAPRPSDRPQPGSAERPPPSAASAPAWRRRATRIAGGVLVLAALTGAVRYGIWSFHHESTDDAFIDCHVVNVSSRVAGRVTRVHVDDNQRVPEGDLVIELDPADFQARLDERRAAQDEARGRLAQARAQLTVAEAMAAQTQADIVAAQADAVLAASDLARYHATTSGAVSRQAVDAASTAAARSAAQVEVRRKAHAAAVAQIELARANVETAAAAVETAAANVEQARLQLSYTTLHAKIAGRVTNKRVMAGDWIQVGQTLFALVPEHVWVTANFKETQLRFMRPGQPVTIHVDAYDRDFRGRVDSIEAGSGAFFSLLPPENATGNYVKVVQRVPVKILFDEPIADVLLGPGMSVEPTVTVR
jgi:membrane fusion protein (multidrug efflux system)